MNEKIKVLVVENDSAVALTMTCLLSREKFEVESAFTGQCGLAAAITRKFDLILLAVDLPDMDGFEICHQLKQRHISYQTPIILLSGNRLEERRAMAMELGAVDFIEKPSIVDDLMECVTLYLSPAEASETTTATGEAA